MTKFLILIPLLSQLVACSRQLPKLPDQQTKLPEDAQPELGEVETKRPTVPPDGPIEINLSSELSQLPPSLRPMEVQLESWGCHFYGRGPDRQMTCISDYLSNPDPRQIEASLEQIKALVDLFAYEGRLSLSEDPLSPEQAEEVRSKQEAADNFSRELESLLVARQNQFEPYTADQSP